MMLTVKCFPVFVMPVGMMGLTPILPVFPEAGTKHAVNLMANILLLPVLTAFALMDLLQPPVQLHANLPPPTVTAHPPVQEPAVLLPIPVLLIMELKAAVSIPPIVAEEVVIR